MFLAKEKVSFLNELQTLLKPFKRYYINDWGAYELNIPINGYQFKLRQQSADWVSLLERSEVT
jgi:hypothetical protein